VKADRITGKLVNMPPTPPPTPAPALPLVNPPQAGAAYDDSTWALINTPHDMLIAQDYAESAHQNQAYIFRGIGWYRKHFNLPAAWRGTSVWLYIEGSFHETQFWLNGKGLGFEDENVGSVHKQGYTSYWLRIDNATKLKWGPGAANANVLASYVDASSGTGWWYEGGGLMRHAKLVSIKLSFIYRYVSHESCSQFDSLPLTSLTIPQVSAPLLHIPPSAAWVWTTGQTSAADGGGVTFNVEATVQNDGAKASTPYTVRVAVVETGTTAVVGTANITASAIAARGEATTTAAITVASGVKLWSVQSPALYDIAIEVETASGLDSVTLTTGVRTVKFDAAKGLLLNDANVKVRGFCDHSNFGGVGGALPDRLNLFRAQKLRSVGANAWRMAHNAPSPARLDFMDALGMLAMDENRDYGGMVGQGGHTSELVPDELRDMIDLVKRDRSHPSVMVWSLCNEVGCDNETAFFYIPLHFTRILLTV
jgi:beta-galactosidase/beta-glucuronidase